MQWQHRLAPAALGLVLFLPAPLAGQGGTRIGSIDRFLMPRADEIALARSAGPAAVAAGAAVLVLTPHGYEQAVSGSNGFTCFVGRGWSGPVVSIQNGTRVVSAGATDPKFLAPHCFNASASETVVPWHQLMTTALIAGTPVEDLHQVTGEALEAGQLKVPGPGAMAYMISRGQYLGPRFGHWKPHIMMYTPYATNALMGAEGFSHDYPSVTGAGTPWAITVIPIEKFSDGSAP